MPSSDARSRRSSDRAKRASRSRPPAVGTLAPATRHPRPRCTTGRPCVPAVGDRNRAPGLLQKVRNTVLDCGPGRFTRRGAPKHSRNPGADTRRGVHRRETAGPPRRKQVDGTVWAPRTPPPLQPGPLRGRSLRPSREVAVDTGDTAWVLASSALVLLMTPGLALFYGGMVRAKSVLNMMMMTFGALAVGRSCCGCSYGYSLGLRQRPRRRPARQTRPSHFGLQRPGRNAGRGYASPPAPGPAITGLAFVAFQVDVRDHHRRADLRRHRRPGQVRRLDASSSASGRRWSTSRSRTGFRLRRHQSAHGGWIVNAAARRSTSPAARRSHINAGAAGLALALVLGKRVGFGRDPMRPHNLHAGHARRRPAVVRLVRLQRRLRARRRRPGRRRSGVRPRRSPPARRHARLAAASSGPRRPRHLAGRRLRRGRRPGRDHAGLRLGRPARRARHRASSPASSAPSRSA